MMDFDLLEKKLNEHYLIVTDFFSLYAKVPKLNTTWNFIVNPVNLLEMALAKKYFMHINDFDVLNLKQVYYNPRVINPKQYIIMSYVDNLIPGSFEPMFYRNTFEVHVIDKNNNPKEHPVSFISFDVLCEKAGEGITYYDKNPKLNEIKQLTYILQIILKENIYITEDLYDTVRDLIDRYRTFHSLKIIHFEDPVYIIPKVVIPYKTVHGYDLRILLP